MKFVIKFIGSSIFKLDNMLDEEVSSKWIVHSLDQ